MTAGLDNSSIGFILHASMDVKLLETFRAVIDHRSVTATAKAMGLTQPAVSSQLSRLEGAVGFALFEKAGRRLNPTAEGRLFYTEAVRMLAEFDRLQTAANRIREGRAGRLVVAGHPWASTALLPGVVGRFLADRPGVELRMIARHSDVISQLLPTETYEIGIAELPIDDASIRVVRYQMRCVAVLPPGHPLAERRVLTPALLAGHPMVAPVRSLQVRSRVFDAFAGDGAKLEPVVEAELFASLCELVAAGVGWSIVDPLSARRFGHRDLVVRRFEPEIRYEVGVFHRQDREPSMLAAAFLALLDAELKSLTPPEDR